MDKRTSGYSVAGRGLQAGVSSRENIYRIESKPWSRCALAVVNIHRD